ncbi:MAG TPA: hypothetical protein PKC43_06270 [Phycisphaerales bacterium]|nr:hypothetical protein [Phycisphaerales bacterium]HMP37037.1 hypothetical protein [Phycisphaerales bacterium]
MTNGAAASWGVLRSMAMLAFVPAIGAAIGSAFIPQLRTIAGTLLGIALLTASAPWFLERYGDRMFLPAILVTSIALAACAAIPVWLWVRKLQQTQTVIRKLESDAQLEEDPRKRLMDIGGATALKRLSDPTFDRKFRYAPIVEQATATPPLTEINT